MTVVSGRACRPEEGATPVVRSRVLHVDQARLATRRVRTPSTQATAWSTALPTAPQAMSAPSSMRSRAEGRRLGAILGRRMNSPGQWKSAPSTPAKP